MNAYERFKEFLAANPDQKYNFLDNRSCVLAQFGQHEHPRMVIRGGASRYFIYAPNEPVKVVEVIAFEASDALMYANTFGQALENLIKREE